jgi:hypothetical protein
MTAVEAKSTCLLASARLGSIQQWLHAIPVKYFERKMEIENRYGSKSQASPIWPFAACASICKMERKW